VAAGFGVQDGHAGVGGGVPVGVEIAGGVEVQEREPGEVRAAVGGGVVDGGVHGATEVVGGEQVHPAVADDRRRGEPVEDPLQAGPGCPPFRRPAAGSHAGAGAVGGVGQVEQVGPLGVVELQR